MSKLLLNEQPLLIMPGLAKKIGLNESIVLQQVHYWNEINRKANNNYRDGYYWTFNSYTDWEKQFPFWSRNTIKRTIRQLEQWKLLRVGNYNKLKIDRTKWYRIDYDVLQALETSPLDHIEPTNVPIWYNHLANLGLPSPETNTETKKETNTLPQSEIDAYIFFDDTEEQDLVQQANRILETGREKITKPNYQECLYQIETAIEDHGIDELNEFIRKYKQEKKQGRSVENFIKYLELYQKGVR